MKKGFLKEIFGISTEKKKLHHPHKKRKRRSRKNKFYLFRIEEFSSVSNILAEYLNLNKAKFAAQSIARRSKSKLPIFIIKGRSRKEAEFNASGYREDLDDPSEYIAYNRAVRCTVCYFK